MLQPATLFQYLQLLECNQKFQQKLSITGSWFFFKVSLDDDILVVGEDDKIHIFSKQGSWLVETMTAGLHNTTAL